MAQCFVDLVRPKKNENAYLFDILMVLGGSLFLAIAAQISIPLWFTPVPLTLQTFAVLTLGALLGSKRGALAVIAYLVQGIMGLPVFAGGGAGIAKIFGPTGGYLIAFIGVTYLIGYLLERGWRNHFGLSFLALCLGEALILIMGSIWLGFFVGMSHAFALGIYPFLIGGFIKVCAASILIPSGWKIFNRT